MYTRCIYLPKIHTIITVNYCFPFIFAELSYRNCLDIYNKGHHESGIYEINVGKTMPISYKVYCDMSLPGGGWTVILKRRETPSSETVQFNEPWYKYEEGIGHYDGEFFMSLPVLHEITNRADMEVFVGLQSHEKSSRFNQLTNCDIYKYARYSKFSVGNSHNLYKLHVSGYDSESTAGDALSAHNNAPFSTYDNDNDNLGRYDEESDDNNNCAKKHKGGWWYTSCQESNLTGVRRSKNTNSDDGIQWRQWPGNRREEMKSVIMAIRPVTKS